MLTPAFLLVVLLLGYTQATTPECVKPGDELNYPIDLKFQATEVSNAEGPLDKCEAKATALCFEQTVAAAVDFVIPSPTEKGYDNLTFIGVGGEIDSKKLVPPPENISTENQKIVGKQVALKFVPAKITATKGEAAADEDGTVKPAADCNTETAANCAKVVSVSSKVVLKGPMPSADVVLTLKQGDNTKTETIKPCSGAEDIKPTSVAAWLSASVALVVANLTALLLFH